MANGQTASQLAPHTSTGVYPEVDTEYTQRRLGLPPAEQLFRIINNHKWAVLAIMAACLLAGLVTTLLTTPLYTASARIEISRRDVNVTNVEGVEEGDRSRDQEFYDTQYALLQARSLATRVARDLNLANDEEFFATFGVADNGAAQVQQAPETALNNGRASARVDAAVGILLRNVTISPIRGSSLVDVRFTSPDRELSARVANSWIEQFIAANLAKRFASTADARKILETQLEELRKRLEESEKRLVDYASANEIVTFGGAESPGGEATQRSTLVSADLQAMNQALADARADRIRAESAWRQSAGTREALNNPTINGLRQRRALVVADREKLLATFEPGYPAVQQLTSEIAALDKSIAQEEGRVRSVGRESYNEALQREQQLAAQVQGLKGQFAGQNQASIQYNIYQREVNTNRQIYDSLLQRYKEIGVAGVGTNNIAIVDRALEPKNPSSPNLLLYLAVSLLAGLGLAAAYVFLREQLNQSLRDPQDVKRLLGLPTLGVVPALEEEKLAEDLNDVKSVVSEAYFSIGTSLSFLTGHGTPRSMLFTSTMPNEGKSTSAVALARMLARTGKRVLLIDADLRNPSAHQFIGDGRAVGLSNYLAGENDVPSLVQSTDFENLSLMAAGPIPPNPAELLTGPRLGELLRADGLPFDHYVVDGPPVLGLADSPLIASAVEGVIFTIQANAGRLRSIETAIQRLRDANANVFGAIVTKVDSRNSTYGYGYGYGYGDKYGYGYSYGKN
jgi:capsular exopolysaccharide synthesis family protein